MLVRKTCINFWQSFHPQTCGYYQLRSEPLWSGTMKINWKFLLPDKKHTHTQDLPLSPQLLMLSLYNESWNHTATIQVLHTYSGTRPSPTNSCPLVSNKTSVFQRPPWKVQRMMLFYGAGSPFAGRYWRGPLPSRAYLIVAGRERIIMVNCLLRVWHLFQS